MVSKSSSSDVSAPNFDRESISDEDLVRGFLLALGAGGRKEKTLNIYEESIRMLSDFARSLGLPGLATMDRTHIRHWLTSLHQRGNKPATVSVRYRSLNRFFNWCVDEDERTDNPMDRVDPPKIPARVSAGAWITPGLRAPAFAGARSVVLIVSKPSTRRGDTAASIGV